MTGKQLLYLISATLILVAAGILIHQRQTRSWNVRDSGIGQTLFPELPVNDVKGLSIVDEAGVLELECVEGRWVVPDRYGYPAAFDKIRALILSLSNLKITQPVPNQQAAYRQLNLEAPEQADNPGILLRLDDAAGEPLATLILGKEHIRAGQGGAGGGWPDGRYVRVGGASLAGLVSETFANVTTGPAAWLDKTFFRIEAKKEISLSVNGEVQWEFAQAEAGGKLELQGLGENEDVDADVVRGVTNAFSWASFEDVADPQLAPEQTGLATPAVFRAVTPGAVEYTIAIGSKSEDNRYYVKVTTAYTGPSEREVDEGEDDETRQQKDDAFAAALSKATETVREVNERTANWVYLVSPYTVESVLKKRSDLVKQPVAEDSQTEQPEPAPGG